MAIVAQKAAGGCALAKAAFELAGIAYQREEFDYSAGSASRERLLAVNALGQGPALVLRDGSVLTESLAIVHYLDDLAPKAGLIPPRGDPERARFYRCAVFLVAAVYPTYTYGDEPVKWVHDQVSAASRAHERPRSIPRGDDPVVPRAPRFDAHTPQVTAIGARASARPEVARVIARNFT